jgi:hypothetical protein
VTVTEAPASVANTEATEDEQTEDFLKKKFFFQAHDSKCRRMGELMDRRREKKEEKSLLRHHLAMLKCPRDRIKNLWRGRGLILAEL